MGGDHQNICQIIQLYRYCGAVSVMLLHVHAQSLHTTFFRLAAGLSYGPRSRPVWIACATVGAQRIYLIGTTFFPVPATLLERAETCIELCSLSLLPLLLVRYSICRLVKLLKRAGGIKNQMPRLVRCYATKMSGLRM